MSVATCNAPRDAPGACVETATLGALSRPTPPAARRDLPAHLAAQIRVDLRPVAVAVVPPLHARWRRLRPLWDEPVLGPPLDPHEGIILPKVALLPGLVIRKGVMVGGVQGAEVRSR